MNTSIPRLPEEIFCGILFFCDKPTLKQCRIVCKSVSKLASDLLLHNPSITNLRKLNQLHKLLDHDNTMKLNHSFRKLDFSKRSQIFSGRLLNMILEGSQVDSLNLSNCSQLSVDDLSTIMKSLNRIKHLNLDGCSNVTDHVLSLLESRHLQSISLLHCSSVTNNAFETLSKFPILESIKISFAKKITGLGFRSFYLNSLYRHFGVKHVCKLKQLHFEACGRFEDVDVEVIAIECFYLNSLELISNSGTVSAKGVETALETCRNLSRLTILHPRKHNIDGQIFNGIQGEIIKFKKQYQNVLIELD